MNHLIMSRANHLNLFSNGVKTHNHERTSLQSRRGCSVSEVDEEPHFLYAVRLFQHPLSAWGSLLGNYFEGGFFCLSFPHVGCKYETPPVTGRRANYSNSKTALNTPISKWRNAKDLGNLAVLFSNQLSHLNLILSLVINPCSISFKIMYPSLKLTLF